MQTRKYSRLAITLCTLIVVSLWWSGCTKDDEVEEFVLGQGWDLLRTFSATMEADTNGDGVDDIVEIKGVPFETYDFGGTIGVKDVGNTDTIVRRVQDVRIDASGSGPISATIPVQFEALQLVTKKRVNLGGGEDLYFFTLSQNGDNTGELRVESLDRETGTFEMEFTVTFDVRLGSLDGPIVDQRSLDFDQSGEVGWGRTPPEGAVQIEGVNLFVDGSTSETDFWIGGDGGAAGKKGVADICTRIIHNAPKHRHEVGQPVFIVEEFPCHDQGGGKTDP